MKKNKNKKKNKKKELQSINVGRQAEIEEVHFI